MTDTPRSPRYLTDEQLAQVIDNGDDGTYFYTRCDMEAFNREHIGGEQVEHETITPQHADALLHQMSADPPFRADYYNEAGGADLHDGHGQTIASFDDPGDAELFAAAFNALATIKQHGGGAAQSQPEPEQP